MEIKTTKQIFEENSEWFTYGDDFKDQLEFDSERPDQLWIALDTEFLTNLSRIEDFIENIRNTIRDSKKLQQSQDKSK